MGFAWNRKIVTTKKSQCAWNTFHLMYCCDPSAMNVGRHVKLNMHSLTHVATWGAYCLYSWSKNHLGLHIWICLIFNIFPFWHFFSFQFHIFITLLFKTHTCTHTWPQFVQRHQIHFFHLSGEPLVKHFMCSN